jgi:type II secretory pathway component GspD/PulD (secretin)
VIGGLREDNENMAETKVPVFGEIPFIGRLFRHRAHSVSGTNLLVFVTPTIIDFHESDEFGKSLEKLRQDFAKPFTAVGEEEDVGAK